MAAAMGGGGNSLSWPAMCREVKKPQNTVKGTFTFGFEFQGNPDNLIVLGGPPTPPNGAPLPSGAGDFSGTEREAFWPTTIDLGFIEFRCCHGAVLCHFPPQTQPGRK